MLSALRALVLFALIAGLAVPFAAGQPEPAVPTAEQVKTLKEKFQTEREQALKAKFPTETITKADDLAKRAEEALKTENFKAAMRHLRDARWQLPYLPPGLPPHVTRVLGESRMRHADRVNALAYNADGTLVASASKDGTVKVWDLGNGREIATYRGHLDQPDDPTRGTTNVFSVSDVAFHPKEKVIASASGNQVHLWNPETGKSIKTILNLGKTDKPIKCLAYSPDGKQLAVGADDGVLRVLESDTGKAIYTSPSRNARIEKVAFSPNGKLVALGDSNSQVAVYAPGGKNQLAMSVQGVDLGEVMGVAFTADNGAVFTCGRDGKARLTAGPNPDGSSAGNTATRLREFLGHSGPVTGLAVTTDGKFLVTCGEDKTVRVWDVTTAKPLRSFQGHMTKTTAVAVRADGRQVASASDDGAVRVWDLNTTDDHRAMKEATDSLMTVAYSPNGKRLATGGADKKIRVYEPESGKLEVTLDAGVPLTSLAFLPDSNQLVASGGEKVVKVWDITAKKVAKELPGHTLVVLAVAASDDGKLVVSGGADATVFGFDPNAGKELWKFTARKAVCGVSVRKGNKHVALGLADGALIVLDVSGATPKEVFSQPAHVAGIAGVAFSPDGNRLASVGGDGALRVWQVADNGNLTQIVRFDGQAKPTSSTGFSPLTGVAFSPDSRYVAAAGADSIVRVWDVQTKSEIRGLRGHSEWVTGVAFSPDGRYVASVAAEKDNTVRVFDLPPLDSSSAAGGHMLAVNAVAVSPNGKFVATAGTDQTIKIWDIATGKEVGTLIGNADTPFAIAFVGNNMVVMGGSLPTRDTGRLHFWNTTPPQPTRAVPTGEVYTVISNADGSKIGVWATRPAVGDTVKNNSYEIYDAKGEKLSATPDQGRNVRSATFTTDLTWAIAGDEAGTVRIFDLARKERIGGDWPIFQRGVADLGITADKKYLVVADDEGTVKIADVAKRDVLVSGKTHKNGVRAVLVSPTGTTFLTISNDREIKVWSLTDLKDAKDLKELRSWALPVTINGAAYTPDGRSVVTANADGTAYVLELP